MKNKLTKIETLILISRCYKLFLQKNYDQCIEQIDKLVNSDTEIETRNLKYELHFLHALILKTQKKFKESIDQLFLAKKYSENDDEILRELLTSYYASKNFLEAVTIYNENKHLFSHDEKIKQYISKAYSEVNKNNFLNDHQSPPE